MLTEHAQNLMHRVVDGDATMREWREWTQMADDQPQLWRQLAHAQRDHALLVREVTNVALRASAIDPLADAAIAPRETHEPAAPVTTMTARQSMRMREPVGGRPGQRGITFGAWSGWLAACVVLASVVVTQSPMHNTPPASTGTGGPDVVPASMQPDEYLNGYVASGRAAGRVIDELPTKVLLQSRPTEDGYELVYIRQILERATVPDLYEFSAEDELGRRMPVRVDDSARAYPASYVQ